MNIRRERRMPDRCMDRFGPVPIAAAEDQLPVRSCSLLEFIKCGDQADVIFGGMFEERDVKEEWPMQLIKPCHFGAGGFTRAGKKTLMFEAILNDRDLFLRQSEETRDVPCSGSTDSDDPILPLNDSRDDH